MPVSAVGSNLTFTIVGRLAVGVVAIFCVLSYLYGPAASPALRNAAIAQCNEHAEGNFRSFRLSWQVGVYPHWTCWDASRPEDDAVSLGWWTNPFV
jgi:hypothetical protein